MLSGRRAAGLGLALAIGVIAGDASAQGEDRGLRKPERLTVGVADDLLGQLSPDARTLYFVSNRDTTNQLFAQNVADGREKQLFDDDADITWPRVSPDGASLLYISFREQAAGQLCLRQLPDGGQRRCLKGSGAALQAEWIDPHRIALVTRESIKGDLRVLEVTVGSSLSARPLLDRNLTGPAVSPDGRWLVYVPVERTVASVGPAFAAHAAQQLEVARLGSAAPGVRLDLGLPGQTGQPAFARDGRSLYIVQFFSDTNHDGAVDASDHGVLFRIPLTFTADTLVPGPPEQLTETSWNCEYPAPFVDRLIATCSQDGSLDVYSLPLDGEVPTGWTSDELQTAMENAASRPERQLLASRRLARETTVPGRRLAMLRLAMVHLELEEFRPAEFYAKGLFALHDDTTVGISKTLQILVDQRRASRRREQGRMMDGFAEEAHQRLETLKATADMSEMARDLTHLVRSEVADSVGDKGLARAELVAVTLDETTPMPIVEAYYQQADALYRELDDRDALVAACRQLSTIQSFTPDEQLKYARAAVRAMVRGLSIDDANARLSRERAGVTPAESELAFALDMTRAVFAIRDSHAPPAVGDALIALYAAQPRAGRRRALMDEATRRADDVDADDVLDALADRDIADVKRGTAERPRAERLYRRLITARAYENAAAKRYDAARSDFEDVARETDSYEAVVGVIDMRVKLGESFAHIEASYEKRGMPPALSNFAKAYLLARQLPKLEGKAHAKALGEAMASLDASWSQLKEQRIAQAVFGALLHEGYIETGDLEAAEKANVHYLIALELVSENPRFRAMILGELGLLHTDVGNYRIALGYLLDRDKLPYMDNAEGLDVLVSKAQALLHVGRDREAAATGDAAMAMIARNPQLEPYRVLALDEAAVSNLSAGLFARALALYDDEIPRLEHSSEPQAERNRIVARIARAAAAVGAGLPARALPDLDEVDRHLADPKAGEILKWAHAPADRVIPLYRMILDGLRANANRQLGRFDAEATALKARLAALGDRFDEGAREETERKQMLTEAHLAINASERHDAPAAGLWLGKALTHADDLRARAHDVLGKAGLDVLWLAAALTVSMKVTLVADLPKRIQAASVEMATRRDPALRSYERWFEIYGAMVGPDAGAVGGGAPVAGSTAGTAR